MIRSPLNKNPKYWIQTQRCQFFLKKIGSSDAFTGYLAFWGHYFTIWLIILRSYALFCILGHDFIFSSNFAIFYGIYKVCQSKNNAILYVFKKF